MESGRSTGSLVAGLVLLGLGGLLLFAQLLDGRLMSHFWPFLIVGTGLTFFMVTLAGGRSAGGLAIPGSIITTVGLIVLFQNSLGCWNSWAYVWPLIVVAVGAGIYIKGVWNRSESSRRSGLIVAGIGALLFLIFGSLFGLGFGPLGISLASRIVWPFVLIGIGLFLVLRWSRLPGRHAPSDSTMPSGTTSATR